MAGIVVLCVTWEEGEVIKCTFQMSYSVLSALSVGSHCSGVMCVVLAPDGQAGTLRWQGQSRWVEDEAPTVTRWAEWQRGIEGQDWQGAVSSGN